MTNWFGEIKRTLWDDRLKMYGLGIYDSLRWAGKFILVVFGTPLALGLGIFALGIAVLFSWLVFVYGSCYTLIFRRDILEEKTDDAANKIRENND